MLRCGISWDALDLSSTIFEGAVFELSFDEEVSTAEDDTTFEASCWAELCWVDVWLLPASFVEKPLSDTSFGSDELN
jgi:hypothetical protein